MIVVMGSKHANAGNAHVFSGGCAADAMNCFRLHPAGLTCVQDSASAGKRTAIFFAGLRCLMSVILVRLAIDECITTLFRITIAVPSDWNNTDACACVCRVCVCYIFVYILDQTSSDRHRLPPALSAMHRVPPSCVALYYVLELIALATTALPKIYRLAS